MANAADHIEDIAGQGWTRVDTAPGEWVALVPNENNSAFGGHSGNSLTMATTTPRE